ncbi:MAG: hypothetical protein HZA48_07535 [Planctomycetes bacterium]|nr:hypothetical protein [Planctomycetota bacterium]
MILQKMTEQQKKLQSPIKMLRAFMWFIFGLFIIGYAVVRFLPVMSAIPETKANPAQERDETFSYLKEPAQTGGDEGLIGTKMMITLDENGNVLQATPAESGEAGAGEGENNEPEPTKPVPVLQPAEGAENPAEQPAGTDTPRPPVYVPEHKEPVVFDGILNNVPLMIEKVDVKKDDVFWYFVKYLYESKEEEIAKRVKPNFKNQEISYSACVENGADFRGEYVHGRGTVITYSPRRLDKNKYGMEDTWEGFVTDFKRTGFYFCSLTPLPQFPSLKETEIEFDGIFVYLVKYEAEYGNKRVIPFVMVKSIRKVQPFVDTGRKEISLMLIIIAIFVVLAIMFVAWKYKKDDREYKEKMQMYMKKKPLVFPKKTAKTDESPTEKIGPPDSGPGGGGETPGK